MKRALRLFLVTVCLFLCVPLCSCGQRDKASALDVVLAMADAQADCPAGDVYVLPDSYSLQVINREYGTEQRIRLTDDALIRAALGRTSSADGEVWECSPALVDDGALRLSTADSPCEFIVLRCISRSHTSKVADLLLHRLELLRREYRATDFEHILAHAQVVIMEKYVMLAVCTSPDHCISVAKRALS